VRAVARLPRVVAEAAADLRVHAMAAYAVDLSNAFNQFYRDCPVLADHIDAATRAGRLALVADAKQALANTLGLLGIEAPESM